jgi:hypothetical protein
MASRGWFRPKRSGYQKVDGEVDGEVISEVGSECSQSLLEYHDEVEDWRVAERAALRERMRTAQQSMVLNGFRSAYLVHAYLSLSAQYYDPTPMAPIP